jgi:hypothetical protein
MAGPTAAWKGNAADALKGVDCQSSAYSLFRFIEAANCGGRWPSHISTSFPSLRRRGKVNPHQRSLPARQCPASGIGGAGVVRLFNYPDSGIGWLDLRCDVDVCRWSSYGCGSSDGPACRGATGGSALTEGRHTRPPWLNSLNYSE